MVMLRPPGKATKIAERVMKGKGIKVRKPESYEKTKLQTPYLQHQDYMKHKKDKKEKKHKDMKHAPMEAACKAMPKKMAARGK